MSNIYLRCQLDDRLEANFKEIYHAIKFPSESNSLLVSNFSSSRIYDSRYGWGRLWRWFYHLADWMTGHSWHEEKLRRAILKTHALFNREITKLQGPLKRYLEYLNHYGKGYAIDEGKYFTARSLITAWNTSTKLFLKMAESSHFKNSLHKATLINFENPLFPSSTTSQLLQTCQKIIDLEGLTQGPLPLAILKKVLREKPLNPLDQKDLDKWICKINKLNLEVKPLHQALEAVNHIYYKANDHFSESCLLTTLELFLEDKGCKIFQKAEPKHVLWRQNIEPGTHFRLQRTEIILGKEIYPKFSGSDQTRAYDIEDQPDRIALISHNRIHLPLRALRMQKRNEFEIPSVIFLDRTQDGKIAVLERLKPLNAIQWSSTNGKISPKDEAIVNSLSALIQSFISKKITPTKFNTPYLMINKHHQLKVLKPSQIDVLDFNALEDFIFECSAGNPTIFQALMLKSGMTAHPIAKFYQDIISNTLFNDPTTPDDLAGIYRISDPKVVDRAILLTSLIKPIKNQLLLNFRELDPKQSPQTLEKKVNILLLKEYMAFKTAGRLWPTFLESRI